MSFDQLSVPVTARPPMQWGSDALAELLSTLDLPYIALNPGASYRGLHDSLVNYLGNRSPKMIVCLHEEHAVAVAHGYAKVTEQPLAVALHANVGLMHGTMALYDAYCDRVPMLVLGATGPVDAAERRPWIDWIHTSADQGAIVRSYIKWDDQPASVAAALESLLRANAVTRAYPSAPVYVNLDSTIQERELTEPVQVPDPSRYSPATTPWPGGPAFDRAIQALDESSRPVMLVGRVGRSEAAWAERIELAEAIGAAVVCDLKTGAGFPTAHPLTAAPAGTFLSDEAGAVIREADLIVSLDWIDLAGTVGQAAGAGAVTAKIIDITSDHVLHNGWSKDHFALPAVDVQVTAHPDEFVRLALTRLYGNASPREGWHAHFEPTSAPAPGLDLTVKDIAAAMRTAFAGREISLARLPLGWDGADLRADHPLDYLGQDGGAGIGSGPGMAVGAALALNGSGRTAVAVLGDGDFMMGVNALWTAAHYELPLLVVVANNRSFFNDEMHQERVARRRGRPVENRWVGQQIRNPDPDLAMIARGMGLVGHGPIDGAGELAAILPEAIEQAAAGAAVVVDVRVVASGYPGGPTVARAVESATVGS